MIDDPLMLALRERKHWLPGERSEFPMPEEAERSKAELLRWTVLTVAQDNPALVTITIASVLYAVYRLICGLLV